MNIFYGLVRTPASKIDHDAITAAINDLEKVLELALNAGAEDCISYSGDFHEIHCEKDDVYKVKKLLEKNINLFISTGIEWVPSIFVEVNGIEKNDIVSFLENIEDNDDVQNVYSNVKFVD